MGITFRSCNRKHDTQPCWASDTPPVKWGKVCVTHVKDLAQCLWNSSASKNALSFPPRSIDLLKHRDARRSLEDFSIRWRKLKSVGSHFFPPIEGYTYWMPSLTHQKEVRVPLRCCDSTFIASPVTAFRPLVKILWSLTCLHHLLDFKI